MRSEARVRKRLKKIVDRGGGRGGGDIWQRNNYIDGLKKKRGGGKKKKEKNWHTLKGSRELGVARLRMNLVLEEV